MAALWGAAAARPPLPPQTGTLLRAPPHHLYPPPPAPLPCPSALFSPHRVPPAAPLPKSEHRVQGPNCSHSSTGLCEARGRTWDVSETGVVLVSGAFQEHIRTMRGRLGRYSPCCRGMGTRVLSPSTYIRAGCHGECLEPQHWVEPGVGSPASLARIVQ